MSDCRDLSVKYLEHCPTVFPLLYGMPLKPLSTPSTVLVSLSCQQHFDGLFGAL
jgi:hypothetical protein